MLMMVVALVRAGGDVTRYWHWRALLTLGVVCVEPLLLFSPCVTIKENREGEPQIVSVLSGIFPVPVMIVISSLDFFL